jgi:hypothetical protein
MLHRPVLPAAHATYQIKVNPTVSRSIYADGRVLLYLVLNAVGILSGRPARPTAGTVESCFRFRVLNARFRCLENLLQSVYSGELSLRSNRLSSFLSLMGSLKETNCSESLLWKS